MYKCQVTGKMSAEGEKLNKITVATRPRTYTRWVRDEDTKKWEEIECGSGWEIVKEINASDEGLALYNSWSPEQQAMFNKVSKS